MEKKSREGNMAPAGKRQHGTCKECKWWYNTDYDKESEIVSPRDPDTYKFMVLPFEVRFCHCPKITFFERPVESDGATVIDGSQYQACLITAPDFGCVQWVSKDTAVRSEV